MSTNKNILEMIEKNIFEIYDDAWSKAQEDLLYVNAKLNRDKIIASSKELTNYFNEKEAVISQEDRKKMLECQACESEMQIVIAKYIYYKGMNDLLMLFDKLNSLNG